MNKIFVYTAFICGVVAAGYISSFSNMPGEWYKTLLQPSFNPPAWVFAPVWAVLYVMIGWVGARTFFKRQEDFVPFALWGGLLILNLIWPSIFFGAHMLLVACIVITLLFFGILVFIARNCGHDRLSAVLFVPYAVWVGFATLLNVSIVYLN